jgi:hypothetical protein
MHPQREAALERLAATGIWRSNYEPPLLRMLWRLNIDVRPPHFAPFWANALVTGLFFGTLWSALMWFTLWSRQSVPLPVAAFLGLGAGVLFGLTMAAYYEFGRRKHQLPAWEALA